MPVLLSTEPLPGFMHLVSAALRHFSHTASVCLLPRGCRVSVQRPQKSARGPWSLGAPRRLGRARGPPARAEGDEGEPWPRCPALARCWTSDCVCVPSEPSSASRTAGNEGSEGLLSSENLLSLPTRRKGHRGPTGFVLYNTELGVSGRGAQLVCDCPVNIQRG